jgi:tetratricopeptide (TPR) repeat protein
MILIGVDTHNRTHALAAVEAGTGRVRGKRETKAEQAGHLAAVRRPPVLPARSRVLSLALHTIAAWHVLAGDFALADSLLAEADSILAATGDAPMSHARLRLAAWRGGDAQPLITASIRDATERGEGVLVRHAEDAAAVLYAGLGRYDDALAWARREVEHNPHAFYMTALPELVEAAVRCDEPDEARRAIEALCEKTQASGTAWARGVEARSRALVSEGDDADALYGQAVSLLAESRLGVESARARLLYGERLRRQNRKGVSKARDQLPQGPSLSAAGRPCGGSSRLGHDVATPGRPLGIQGQRDGIAAGEHVAHLFGQEGQVEQAELDPAAALVAVGVQPHHEARPRSQANFERIAGLHPSHDRAVHLQRRLAAAFQQRQRDRLGGRDHGRSGDAGYRRHGADDQGIEHR